MILHGLFSLLIMIIELWTWHRNCFVEYFILDEQRKSDRLIKSESKRPDSGKSLSLEWMKSTPPLGDPLKTERGVAQRVSRMCKDRIGDEMEGISVNTPKAVLSSCVILVGAATLPPKGMRTLLSSFLFYTWPFHANRNPPSPSGIFRSFLPFFLPAPCAPSILLASPPFNKVYLHFASELESSKPDSALLEIDFLFCPSFLYPSLWCCENVINKDFNLLSIVFVFD